MHYHQTLLTGRPICTQIPLFSSPSPYKSKEEAKPDLKSKNHGGGNDLWDQLVPSPAKGEVSPQSGGPKAPHLQPAEPSPREEPPENPLEHRRAWCAPRHRQQGCCGLPQGSFSRRGFCFSPGGELHSFLMQMSRSQCHQIHSNRLLVLSQALGSVALPWPRCAVLATLGFLRSLPPPLAVITSRQGVANRCPCQSFNPLALCSVSLHTTRQGGFLTRF